MVMFIPIALKYIMLHSQWSTLVLAGVMIVVMCYYFCSEDKSGQAPGPRPWPILGSLHLMGGYKIPYAAFTALKVELNFFISDFDFGSLINLLTNHLNTGYFDFQQY